jgi:hypothetical protein
MVFQVKGVLQGEWSAAQPVQLPTVCCQDGTETPRGRVCARCEYVTSIMRGSVTILARRILVLTFLRFPHSFLLMCGLYWFQTPSVTWIMGIVLRYFPLSASSCIPLHMPVTYVKQLEAQVNRPDIHVKRIGR